MRASSRAAWLLLSSSFSAPQNPFSPAASRVTLLLTHVCAVGPCTTRSAGSLFFAFQLMTTIGYGTFTPVTAGGRAFTIVFGVVGITGTGFFLGSCANSLHVLIACALRSCIRRWRRRRQRRRRRGSGGGNKASGTAGGAPAATTPHMRPGEATGRSGLEGGIANRDDQRNPGGVVLLRARGAVAMVLLLSYITLGSCCTPRARADAPSSSPSTYPRLTSFDYP